MTGNTIKISSIVIIILLGFVLLAILPSLLPMARGNAAIDVNSLDSSSDHANNSEPNNRPDKVKAKPIIIWCYTAYKDSHESLEVVLSTGLITHVFIHGWHRVDEIHYYKKKPDFYAPVKIAKKYGVKSIWIRSLWPFWANEGISYATLFDTDYYLREIRILREEAKEIGADFVGLDVEAYGRSPLVYFFTAGGKVGREELKQLDNTLKEVVSKTGKLDFITPAGWHNWEHSWVHLARLANNRITACTYYDHKKRLRTLKQDYEIFGAYLNLIKKNSVVSDLPYFLPHEIFERSELWSHKKGLYIYPHRGKALEIAKALADYARNLPSKIGEPNDINSPGTKE